jgi:hypothetical protein
VSDPTPTAPSRELEEESPQERLDREQRPGHGDAESAARADLCRALQEAGALRNEELVKAAGYAGDPEEWKRRLWRLHNEGYVKVRWVGLANPDPVEVRLTDRGRELLARESGPAPARGA